ncbi:uncharacterized protein K489DRAFT_374524 [Dissoconium aciculare CBS 342.82]|uniref:Uncharacterized protein n=1 Tax=Dissoconium aciculare CBS 342.82 TaxID=1314786 RepID=A0A6J3LRD7_9PEZI|nr:uncharacterized protein K489DRAFT_374524 [Dissoconium aciculare CBS 342.82]KAF1818188.1 hypothetical protein K489DRAFT_374524 [Dissoconium aciculare CBS 342.82]
MEAPQFARIHGAVASPEQRVRTLRLASSSIYLKPERVKPDPLPGVAYIPPEEYTSASTDHLEPYFRQKAEDPVWHPVNQESATELPVSSITVTVDDLDIWLSEWCEVHDEDCGDPGRIVEPVDDDDSSADEWEDGQTFRVLRCCGFDRPPEHEPLVVRGVKPLPSDTRLVLESPFGTSLMATAYATWGAPLKLPEEHLNHNGMMELNGAVNSNEQILQR